MLQPYTLKLLSEIESFSSVALKDKFGITKETILKLNLF